MQTEFIELAGEVNQRDAVLLRRAHREGSQRPLQAGARLEGRRSSASRTSPASATCASRPRCGSSACCASAAPRSSTTTTFVAGAAGARPALGARPELEACDCAVIVTAHPGLDLERLVRDGAARRRLPRRDARYRGPEPGASVTSRRVGSSASATGARTSPATSTGCRTPSSPGSATRSEEALERWGTAFPAAQTSASTWTSCWPTTRSTPWSWPRRSRRTPSWPSGCSRRASTASWRSRSRSRQQTPSTSPRRRERAGRVLMVGHLLEYHPGVSKLKELVGSGELGDIHYIYWNRLNLGKLRAGRERALVAGRARRVGGPAAGRRGAVTTAPPSARATCSPGVEDVVFAFMRFPSGLAAHLHLSWLDPHKERRFTVVGSKRMATFDDMALERKIDDLRQGLRPGLLLLRRVHRALGRHPQRRASRTRSRCGSSAATSSSASATGREPRSGGESGAARGARARAAPALADGEHLCRQARAATV